MSIELVYGAGEAEGVGRTYRSPQEAIAEDGVARQTYRNFLKRYVVRDEEAGLPPVTQLGPDGRPLMYEQEMFTGYGGLGDLVHVRVVPRFMDEPEGYFVALGNLHDGEVGEPPIRRVERFQDAYGAPQTIIYFDDDRCEDWPAEYQPMLHLDQRSFRFTYRPGFGQGESLLRPIDGLVLPEALTVGEVLPSPRAASEPMGQRALELIRLVP